MRYCIVQNAALPGLRAAQIDSQTNTILFEFHVITRSLGSFALIATESQKLLGWIQQHPAQGHVLPPLQSSFKRIAGKIPPEILAAIQSKIDPDSVTILDVLLDLTGDHPERLPGVQ